MKINLTQELKDNTLLSHIVLNCLTDTVAKKIITANRTESGIICDIKLTVNEHELNLLSFIKHWQSQVSRMIKEKAKEITEERFGDINDLLDDLEERLKSEIGKRLEDWEKEA